jgi:hypothetical protein
MATINCKHCGADTGIEDAPGAGEALRNSDHRQGRCVPMPKVQEIPRWEQRRWGPCFWDKPSVARELHEGEIHFA